MKRSIEFDLVTLRERNQRFMSRGGVMAAAARQKKARTTTREVLTRAFGEAPGLWFTPAGAAPSYTEPNPITVRMWRVGPGFLDSDGPDDALKACRDGVADWLGLDDRNAGVDWPRGMQEKTPPRTPWRVRIEVEDATPGADRKVVLASVPVSGPQSRSKKRNRPAPKPDGDPGEELAARLLVPCIICGAMVKAPCVGPGTSVYGVHVERAQEAGMLGLGGRSTPTAPKPARTGVRKLAQRVAPPQQARLPLARCYAALPWQQIACPALCGLSRLYPGQPIGCTTCHGTGTTGMRLVIEPRVDGLRPPAHLSYEVPAEHRARWGKTITLYPRPIKAAGLGTITVYGLKGR